MPHREVDLLHDLGGTLVGIAWGAAVCVTGWLGRLGIHAFVAWHTEQVATQVKATQGPLIADLAAIRIEQSAIARTMAEHVAHDAQALDRLNETLTRVERGQANLDTKLDATHDSVIKLATETEWIKTEQQRVALQLQQLRIPNGGSYYAVERDQRGPR